MKKMLFAIGLQWDVYFFELKDDATFSDTRPLLFPVERVEKVQYQKENFLSNDELSFEVEGEKFQF